jgi:hypothetical protein
MYTAMKRVHKPEQMVIANNSYSAPWPVLIWSDLCVDAHHQES